MKRQIFSYLIAVVVVVLAALSVVSCSVDSGGSGQQQTSAFGNYAAIGYHISLESFKRNYEEIKLNPGDVSPNAFGNYAAIGYHISLESFKRNYEEIKLNPGDVK